jgi:hypothetical protein
MLKNQNFMAFISILNGLPVFDVSEPPDFKKQVLTVFLVHKFFRF